jgi:Na+/proline symporter
MFTFSGTLVFVNLIFLFLGAVLWMFVNAHSINIKYTDDLFPMIAFNYLGPIAGIVFLIGLISAAYPSADGALTSLTTTFYFDFLGIDKLKHITNKKKQAFRYMIHISIAVIFLMVIVIFRKYSDKAIIDKLFTIAGYTYGPLLGFFSFGLFTKWKVKDGWVPLVAVLSPVICYILSDKSVLLFNGYKFGYELLILNGLLTFSGLYLLREKKDIKAKV